ncbi:MAG: hypothetical protein WCP92_09040 [bacterium]
MSVGAVVSITKINHVVFQALSYTVSWYRQVAVTVPPLEKFQLIYPLPLNPFTVAHEIYASAKVIITPVVTYP